MSIYRDPDCLDRVSASLGAIAGVCSVVTGAQPVAVSAGLLSMATGGISAWRGRLAQSNACLLYTSPSPRDQRGSRMPSSA